MFRRFHLRDNREYGKECLSWPRLCRYRYRCFEKHTITEKLNLQFRAELFNLFNHANFSFPSTSVFNAGSTFSNYQATPSPTAGRIASIIGTARQTQFSLRLVF